MKRSSSGVHVFKLAFEHIEDILNIAFRHVWYLCTRTVVHFDSHMSVWLPIVDSLMFWGELIIPPATVAGVTQILLKFGDLLEVRCYVVDAEFCENPIFLAEL